MTEAERLAERLEELLAKATHRLPWRATPFHWGKAQIITHTDAEESPNSCSVGGKYLSVTDISLSFQDADFTVEAVNALPALITAIRSQAEELERLRGALGELSDYETDRASMWADQHNEWTKDEMHKIARAALGER